jgi:hypothetical protein
MIKSITLLLFFLPFLTFAQSLNLAGKWYAESTEINSAKKVTSVLIMDIAVKREYDITESYVFSEDGSFTYGSTGLFSGTSRSGNWNLENNNQLFLDVKVGEKIIKRVFTLENLGSGKIKITER